MSEAAFTWGSGGEKLTPSDRRRRIAEALMAKGADASPVGHWTQGAARVLQSMLGAMQLRDADAADKAGLAEQASRNAVLMGMPGGATVPTATPSAPSMAGGASGARTMAMPNLTPEMKTGIADAATALGVSPVDLATTISYETGGTFDPTKAGPTTKWGQHRGLIQFGEPQAKQYGVDWSNPAGSQLGANGAIVAYLRDRGVKPGMGLMDIYSTINAGAPVLYNRSDAAAGGAPGTVADKVNSQMAGHRAKAQALFADLPAAGAAPVEMTTGQPGFVIPPAPNSDALPIMQPGGALPNYDQETGRWLGPSNPPALAAAPQPVDAPPSSMDASTFNAIASNNAPLDPVFQTEGVAQPWMGTALAPAAPAAPQVAQAPMPPPRPADLPAPGAVEAIGQAPATAAPVAAAPAPIIADPTKDNAGVLSGLVASEEARKGLPSGAGIISLFGGTSATPAASPAAANDQSIFSRIASALGGGAAAPAPAAAPSPAVQTVAAALPAQAASSPTATPSAGTSRVAAAMATLNSPYARPGERAIAQQIVQQAIAPKNMQTVDLGNAIGVMDAQGNLVRQIPKSASPNRPTFGKIGVDPNTGEDIMGFIDADKATVTPAQKPAPAPTTSATSPAGPAIPPAPPGANPKVWREEQTKAAAKAAAEAQADLPGALAKSEQTLATIDQIRKHPGRESWGAAGASAEWPIIGGGIAGTKGRDFVNLVDQLKGKSFLEAFNGLKGGGAISEVEGAKATAAIARLDRAQSREGFDAALKDLEDVIRSGMDRARKRAGTQAPPAAAPSPTGQTKSGVKWSVE